MPRPCPARTQSWTCSHTGTDTLNSRSPLCQPIERESERWSKCGPERTPSGVQAHRV